MTKHIWAIWGAIELIAVQMFVTRSPNRTSINWNFDSNIAKERSTNNFDQVNAHASRKRLSYVFWISSFFLGEGVSWGLHSASMETKGRGTANFFASLMHAALLSFGKLIWKVCWSEPNPNVIVITRMKALVMIVSLILWKRSLDIFF